MAAAAARERAGALVSRPEATTLDRPELRPTEVTRAEVEDLLYYDEWRMEDWLELCGPRTRSTSCRRTTTRRPTRTTT